MQSIQVTNAYFHKKFPCEPPVYYSSRHEVMLSTSTYKPKASKSTINEFENHSEDPYETNSVEGEGPESYYNGNSRVRGARIRPKVVERRGGYNRGSRAPTFQRRERDDFYVLNRKYQESRHSEQSGYHGKFYEPDKKDVKLNLPEDTRISKLLRRLSTETDPDASLTISKKLLEVLLLPDNSLYVRKAFHILGESMYDILHVSPGPLAKQQSARALGRMGYIMGQEGEFERYQNWIFLKLKNSQEDMQNLLVKSFKETLAFEIDKPVLQDHAKQLLMNNFVTFIEQTDNCEVFKTSLDVLMTCVEIYPDCFDPTLFQDTVDLLFGWHVDHTQPLENIEFISRNLLRIAQHFKYNLDFALRLIENFLEDIANYSGALDEADSLQRVTVLILALNTVLKCLSGSFNKALTSSLVSQCLVQIIRTAQDVLAVKTSDDLLIAANESVGILLEQLETRTQAISSSIYVLIDLEVGLLKDLSDPSKISLLVLISKIIKELSTNLPAELISKLIGPKSEILQMRYSHNDQLQFALIGVYRALLNLKNVSLLQDAYRYILGDLENCYRAIVHVEKFIDDNPFDGVEVNVEHRELSVLFLLRCLTQLANASSILVMWALKPTFLELLGNDLQPHRQQLTPALRYSILFLVYSHCKCYNHFITSSSLVAKQEMFTMADGESPNMGNFEIILDVLYRNLNIDTESEVMLLLIQWFNDILRHSESYLSSLYETDKFTKLCDVLVKCGYSFDMKVALGACENLNRLLGNKELSWNSRFLTNVCDLCKLHMGSTHQILRENYSKLCGRLPWDVATIELNKSCTIYDIKKKSTNMNYSNFMVWMAQHLHLNTSISGDMYPLHFKKFMDYLLLGQSKPELLEDVFISNYKLLDFFYDLALNSQVVLTNWATLESAQFCINAKLRTPLGKPNETFTKIESALNHVGNELIANRPSRDLGRIRTLLQFVEHLEKCLYNASEGCAVAMQQPAKPVRCFFITNTNTCSEWLNRIRLVVMHIAVHAGEPSTVLRHGQALLNDLLQAERTNTNEFERVVVFITYALVTMKEAEALLGLYVWCKTHSARKLFFIKSAAEQAAQRYENALEGYKKVLHTELEAETKSFVYDQIIVCHKKLGDFVDLMNWYIQENPDGMNNGRKYWFHVTDWKTLNNVFDFETGGNTFLQLSDWNYKDANTSWSQFEESTRLESNLYAVALSLQEGCDLKGKAESNMLQIQKGIRNQLTSAPNEHLQHLLVLQYATQSVLNVLDKNTESGFLVSENYESQVPQIDSNILRKILWWSEYFSPIANTFTNNLRLDVIKRARKEKNFRLTFNQVAKFDKDFVCQPGELASSFLQKLNSISQWNKNTALATLEIIKLSYLCDLNNKQGCFNLCAAASTAISKQAEIFPSNELRNISARILLKLSAWLQLSDDVNYNEINTPLGKMFMILPEIDPEANKIIPNNDLIIGKLLQFTANQCPSLAKSWYVFGTWCYRWGRKIVDHSLDVKNNLSDEDSKVLKDLLPTVSEADYEQLVKILSQTKNNIEDEDISSNEINTSEMIKNQLRCVQALRNSSELVIETLVQIWRNTQRRIYTYYAMSAESYFKYLQLSMETENCKKSTDSNVVTVTLRLLRLIVKYALELQSILEEGLELTPTRPWKVIIPQLFSRLNHPEGYVRLRVSDLLCRIAEDAPHLITFPAVVGALEGGLKFNFSEISLPKDCLSQNQETDEANEEEDYESDSEDHNNTLQSCFKIMVDTLSKQDPETIAQVQSLVKELRRITLLWDELWLGTLAQHQSEIQKRQAQLEYEIEKVNDNPHLTKEDKITLISEKHRIIIKPIVFVLEQLQEVTSVEAETPHEKYFQTKYSEEIKKVIQQLKQPEHPEKPLESLQPLKSLQKQFQQKFHKRASYTLKMQEISPILASIRNTLIAMPGLDTKKRVTISYVSNIVSIMPTKTKPKKLIFHGSDGQNYPYLFKGLEDLHLDERIMQFLSIANTMMAHCVDHADRNLYRARHYPVIPLGPRSGLISWVDGTTPVFALYKRWQQREISKANLKNNSSSNVNVPRPSELFYNKLNPLLKEHGVKNVENRKEWPLSVLKQVLCELMTETPSDLLAKELWCNSISANAWWHVIKRYSYSVAVMSIIGYIIGLGDRHLDNVLIDLTSGEVVHIDYNVCFEKGKTLRVPEKVPFRLTPNIKGALGVTGVEGIFKIACENVLKTMRKGRETLLTLLEAFVYDPLIDWTVGNEVLAGTSFGLTTVNTKQSKKDLEKEVTLAMFNVRCIEMKVEWFENKDDILSEIPKLLDTFKSWQKVDGKIKQIEDDLQDLHQQLALVKEAEAQPSKHSLFNLPERYENYCKTQEAIKTAKKDLDKIMKEAESHVSNYQQTSKAIDVGLAQSISELPQTADTNIFDLVKEFLHNAGKNDIITQCEHSENEVEHLSQLQNMSLRRCWQFLQDYNTILTQCPKSYVEKHRMFLYLNWCKSMLKEKSVESCDRVYEKCKSFLILNNADSTIDFSFSLDNLYKDVYAQVGKLYEELTRMRTQESTAVLDKLYANARLGVGTFLNSEANAPGAFEFVIANELVIINKNFLTLETAASRSGDLLIKLTSRDGDWFFDELVLSSTRVVELINNLPLREYDEDFKNCLSCIRIGNNVYKGLHELHYNFHTIILPESMKKIQSEEQSVVQMMGNVKDLFKELDGSVVDVIGQLEKILPCLYMQMEVTPSNEQLLNCISSMRAKYEKLVENRHESLTPGKMLLMGFNGLFDKLCQEVNSLMCAMQTLNVPNAWKKLDHAKEAKSISAHITNPKVYKVLDDIFFLKRLQTINEFFGLTSEMCESFKNTKKSVVYNDEQLVKPVRQFIADFISKQILGTSTEVVAYTVCFLLRDLGLDVSHEIEQKDIGAESKVPLDELCHKSWNHFLKSGLFTQNLVSQASTLSSNLKNAWEKIQEPKRIELKLSVLQSSAMRLQNQLTVYNFMYEEVLPHVYTTFRSKFLVDLKTEMGTLKALYARVKEAYDKQQSLIENAHQRLNWAKGANPNVVEISAAFEEAVKCRDSKLGAEIRITEEILKCCDVILHHEMLRSANNESKKCDKLFLNSFEKWRIACQYANSSMEALSPIEENIMNLLTPQLSKSTKWLSCISETISETIVKLQKDLEEERKSLKNVMGTLEDAVERFKDSYNVHCRVMDDVKTLIKTMTKIEDYAVQTQRFVADYRIYNENFRGCFGKLHPDLNAEEMGKLSDMIGYIGDATPTIYANLLALEEGGMKGRNRLVRQDCVWARSQSEKVDNKGQQRNAYAVNVWRRVKWKLEGRDPDQNRKSTPQEQVDFVIREASNLDNLALLYEGWTPWV